MVRACSLKRYTSKSSILFQGTKRFHNGKKHLSGVIKKRSCDIKKIKGLLI